MSVQRYINSSFWSDDWVDSLNIQEKLIYMYLLTNESTTVAGIYKISIKRIKDDTGIPRDKVAAALDKFSEAKKAFYVHEYIIIPKWPKHQKLGERGKLKLGVNAVLRSLPDAIKEFIIQPGNYDYDLSFLYPVDPPAIPHAQKSENNDSISQKQDRVSEKSDTLSIPYPESNEKNDTLSNDSDSDLDLDSDSDLDLKDTHIDGAYAQKKCDLDNPQKLFIFLWQSNPDVFNSFVQIESPDDWRRFWERSKLTTEQIQTAFNNYTADVREGITDRYFIPATPDRFALKGWIEKSQQRKEQNKTAPPVKKVSKKSLGGLVV